MLVHGKRVMAGIAAVGLTFAAWGVVIAPVAHADPATETQTFCSATHIAIPPTGTIGQGDPYPSTIDVSGFTGTITNVTATLKGLSTTYIGDLNVLLSGPDSTKNLVLLRGHNSLSQSIVGLDILLDSASSSTNLLSGVSKPMGGMPNYVPMPSPVPTPSGASDFSVFTGSAPNGTWSLWAQDSLQSDVSSLTGWCVTITATVPVDTTTTLTSSVPTALPDAPVTFQAAVTDADGPVTTGQVQFSADGDPLGNPVDLESDGTATMDWTPDAAQSQVTATYLGTSSTDDEWFASSHATLTQQVWDPVIPGPFTVAQGHSVTLTSTTPSSDATIGWDLNDDGDFSDAIGTSATVTWAQLEELGLDDFGPGDLPVYWEVELDGSAIEADVVLTITNTAPTITAPATLSGTAGTAVTLNATTVDPSAADTADGFLYTINWGDGSTETVDAAAEGQFSHTYATAGSYDVTSSATDVHGGKSAAATTQVTVAAAEVIDTPTDTPTDSSTDSPPDVLPATGAPVDLAGIVFAAVVCLAGAGVIGFRVRSTTRG